MERNTFEYSASYFNALVCDWVSNMGHFVICSSVYVSHSFLHFINEKRWTFNQNSISFYKTNKACVDLLKKKLKERGKKDKSDIRIIGMKKKFKSTKVKTAVEPFLKYLQILVLLIQLYIKI